MKSDTLIKNVKYILDKYGGHIENDKQLALLFWQKIDNVEIDRETISTVDFLNKATPMSKITSTRVLLNAIKESENK